MNGENRTEIPTLQEVLRWTILFRLVILLSILIPGIVLLYGSGSGLLIYRLLFFFLMVVIFSLLEYNYSRRKRSIVFQIYTHLFFDLLVISSIVDATGSVGSQFTFLYILLILEAGIFLKKNRRRLVGDHFFVRISSPRHCSILGGRTHAERCRRN